MSDWKNYQCHERHHMPTITEGDDGVLTVNWLPDTPVTCVVAKELLLEMVAARNDLRAERDALQAKLDAITEAVNRYALSESVDDPYQALVDIFDAVALHPEGDTHD